MSPGHLAPSLFEFGNISAFTKHDDDPAPTAVPPYTLQILFKMGRRDKHQRIALVVASEKEELEAGV